MTGVVIDPEILVESWIVRMRFTHGFKKLDGFLTGFKNATRLWLKPEMHVTSELFAQSRDMLNRTPKVCTDSHDLFRRCNQRLKTAGHCAHAAFDSIRQKLGQ